MAQAELAKEEKEADKLYGAAQAAVQAITDENKMLADGLQEVCGGECRSGQRCGCSRCQHALHAVHGVQALPWLLRVLSLVSWCCRQLRFTAT